MDTNNNHVKFAYFLNGWSYEKGKITDLIGNGQKVTPSEYVSSNMKGCIFCPSCYTPLSRSPEQKEYFSNGRNACFMHHGNYKHIDCHLRTGKPEGNSFKTVEEVKEAIDNKNLVIINGFIQEEPEPIEIQSGEYDQSQVENIDGPETEVPLAQHTGEKYKAPSIVGTVRGICRNFDLNLYKYFFLPNQQYPIKLAEILIPIERVIEPCEEPKLYYGRISSCSSYSLNPKQHNINMIKLECHEDIVDFHFKPTIAEAEAKGITLETQDKIVLMYGKIVDSGVGLGISKLGWGDFALLPEKYESLLE